MSTLPLQHDLLCMRAWNCVQDCMMQSLLCSSFVSFLHTCSRTFVAIITGIVVGILGVEGWWGFLPMLGTQFLVSDLNQPQKLHSCLPCSMLISLFLHALLATVTLSCCYAFPLHPVQCAPAMILKGATSPEKYFNSWCVARAVFLHQVVRHVCKQGTQNG